MRVLLDENLPHDLIPELVGHEVVTVQGLGWAGTLNGELLRRASGTVDAFVTMDRKLERQHNLGTLPFGVVVIAARSSRIQDLLPLVEAILGALATLTAGPRNTSWCLTQGEADGGWRLGSLIQGMRPGAAAV